jgi:hypothetical protein
MDKKETLQAIIEIQNLIYTIRGVSVKLDTELASIYGVETKRLNEQVKRNQERFPESFMFQLTNEEYESSRSQIATLDNLEVNLRSQIATSSGKHGGKRYLPYVFTEQGVAMLSAVLKSQTAIQTSIQIMNAFVAMRQFLTNNAAVFQRLENIEHKQILADQKFEQLFTALETNNLQPKQGIFFDGQLFDAYVFIANLIKTATTEIILIDNYIDENVLLLLQKRNENCHCTIYTQNPSKTLLLDLEKHNSQYPKIEIKTITKAHDRFLIMDNTTVYHIGASLKDLGKKWFAFSKMEMQPNIILNTLNTNKL